MGLSEKYVEAHIEFPKTQKHDKILAARILKMFLKEHASEVVSMLMTEWNQEEALAVKYEEGLSKGREEGLSKGRAEERLETARNALAKGISLELIQGITGLDMETLKTLAEQAK